MILPILYENLPIAYIQIGQFRDTEHRYSSEECLSEIAKRYGLSAKRLSELYRELPLVSEERLHSLCHIVDILVKSFWMDGLISYNRSMLSIKIERYIQEHLSEKIYLDDLCREFLLSKNAAYQLFRNEFRTTVNEFITKKRLELAEELLQSEQELNITEIASRCGFADYNYFIRLFRRE